MKHIAIDLGGRKSQVCIRREDGSVIQEGSFGTLSVTEFLRRRERGRVILETCAEAFAIARAAKEAGHEVRVVPATLVKTLGVGSRGVKNDRKDARVLSEVSCRIDLPSVHVKSSQSTELVSLVGMRDNLVRCRTLLINSVRGWLRTQLLNAGRGAPSTFAERVRTALSMCPNGLPAYVDRQLQVIEFLNQQIKDATLEISKISTANKVCVRLKSIPGVGAMTAVLFVATLEEVSRFTDAHQVESYLGLTPREYASSETHRRGRITKAGSPTMRWLLIQAAWTLWRTQPNDPMVQWAKKVAERRGRWVAIVALARKLSGVMFAIWRDQSHYLPIRPVQQGREEIAQEKRTAINGR